MGFSCLAVDRDGMEGDQSTAQMTVLSLPRNLRLAKPCPKRQAGSDDCTPPYAPRKVEPSLAPLMALVADGMNSVNAVILDRMQSRIPLIPALAGHLVAGAASACARCSRSRGPR
jgi:hypothetical protein